MNDARVPARRLTLFWRVFAANSGLLALVTLLLLVTPVAISARVRLAEALILVGGLAVALAANFFLLKRAFVPLDELAQRMETVDLLRPGQRLLVTTTDEIGRVVRTFNEMLDRLEAERRESGWRALDAQEAERARIARGLHDEVGQVLTGVLLQLDALGDSSEQQRRHDLVQTKQSVRQALEEVRRISRELRPEVLEHLGLVSALTALAHAFRGVTRLEITREFAPGLPALSPEAELTIYRIAQESLTNVARHSGASWVAISLDHGTGSVVLRVIDNGDGFADGVAPEGHGGLRGMRERALLVGGALAIKPALQGGVEVRLEVPTGRTRKGG
jgi:two-component system, NarL family, sensor histidine kinase UhpB